MGLKDTIQKMKRQLSNLMDDLEKASKGNKAAAQRVRIMSIELSKTFKVFRKESVAAAKSVKKKTARTEKEKKPVTRKPAIKK